MVFLPHFCVTTTTLLGTIHAAKIHFHLTPKGYWVATLFVELSKEYIKHHPPGRIHLKRPWTETELFSLQDVQPPYRIDPIDSSMHLMLNCPPAVWTMSQHKPRSLQTCQRFPHCSGDDIRRFYSFVFWADNGMWLGVFAAVLPPF